GYSLDIRHRLAYCHLATCNQRKARNIWKELSEDDPILKLWLKQNGECEDKRKFLKLSEKLWLLFDKPKSFGGEEAVLDFLSSVTTPQMLPPTWWFVLYVKL